MPSSSEFRDASGCWCEVEAAAALRAWGGFTLEFGIIIGFELFYILEFLIGRTL